MFYFRSYFRLGCVLSFRFFVHIVFELRLAAGHVLRVWRGLVDGLRLALIAAVAPHLPLFAVQQARQAQALPSPAAETPAPTLPQPGPRTGTGQHAMRAEPTVEPQQKAHDGED